MKIKVNSDENLEVLDYELELMEWTEKNLTIFINFTNPLTISRGLIRDMFECSIKSLDFFRSANDSHTLIKDNSKFYMALPMQFPPGFTKEDVQLPAETTQVGI